MRSRCRKARPRQGRRSLFAPAFAAPFTHEIEHVGVFSQHIAAEFACANAVRKNHERTGAAEQDEQVEGRHIASE